MDNINKTPEQQIDEVVESLKALLLSQARNQQEAEEIKRRLDSLGLSCIDCNCLKIINLYIE